MQHKPNIGMSRCCRGVPRTSRSNGREFADWVELCLLVCVMRFVASVSTWLLVYTNKFGCQTTNTILSNHPTPQPHMDQPPVPNVETIIEIACICSVCVCAQQTHAHTHKHTCLMYKWCFDFAPLLASCVSIGRDSIKVQFIGLNAAWNGVGMCVCDICCAAHSDAECDDAIQHAQFVYLWWLCGKSCTHAVC